MLKRFSVVTFLIIVSVSKNGFAFQDLRRLNPEIFKVKIPKEWRSFKDHDYQSYTPYKKQKKQFVTYASFFKFQFEKEPKNILESIAYLDIVIKNSTNL